MRMCNKAMERKLNEGECLDISKCSREGKYYIINHNQFIDDVDYCNAKEETWIWSIGRRYSDGIILASHSADLYQNPDFECLWLR